MDAYTDTDLDTDRDTHMERVVNGKMGTLICQGYGNFFINLSYIFYY